MTPILIKYRAEHVTDLGAVTEEEIRWAVEREKKSFAAYSAIWQGQCIGCAGVARAYGKVYVVWAQFSPGIKQHKIWFYKTTLTQFRAVLARLDWQRIEALVFVSVTENCRWIEALGFRAQSANGVPVLEIKAGPNGENCLRYVMVR